MQLTVVLASRRAVLHANGKVQYAELRGEAVSFVKVR